MIISRTPFRISFFGGGTDYPIWYEQHGGAVISTTIDKYCYITVRHFPPFFRHKYRIRYSKWEDVQDIRDIEHPSVRACLQYLNIEQGVEIIHTGDLPARTGLGSSSSFTVGLLHALHALKGTVPTKQQLALDAIHVEQNIIKENVGSQDQANAAHGGFSKILFGGTHKVRVSPIEVERERLDKLQGKLMLFFTGFTRTASDIVIDQIKSTPQHTRELSAMRDMVDEAYDILTGTADRLDDFGKLLDQHWQYKRSLTSKISNPDIDAIYKAGMDAGAFGGKLLGAGGGGFMLFYVPLERQDEVREKLKHLVHVPFAFEKTGSTIIYYTSKSHF